MVRLVVAEIVIKTISLYAFSSCGIDTKLDVSRYDNDIISATSR